MKKNKAFYKLLAVIVVYLGLAVLPNDIEWWRCFLVAVALIGSNLVGFLDAIARIKTVREDNKR